MDFERIALAGLGAFLIYFMIGGLAFGLLPSLKNEFLKYPSVYRSQDAMKSVMPGGMAAMFVAMLVLAVLYAMLYKRWLRTRRGRPFRRAHRPLRNLFLRHPQLRQSKHQPEFNNPAVHCLLH
jgi:hypothetical protein